MDKIKDNACKEIHRYCKGCLLDVTEKMFCACGEFGLDESSTWTEDELKDMMRGVNK